jgi:hypothetical protein
MLSFEVLTVASINVADFWDVPPCSLVDIDLLIPARLL